MRRWNGCVEHLGILGFTLSCSALFRLSEEPLCILSLRLAPQRDDAVHISSLAASLPSSHLAERDSPSPFPPHPPGSACATPKIVISARAAAVF